MAAANDFSIGAHDWQSQAYVDDWISRDVQKDEKRKPQLRKMLLHGSVLMTEAPCVLDVGGGFGVVTEMLLDTFRNARVTLQDYSQPMLGHARTRLTQYGDRISYVLADLRDPAWVAQVGGPFHLIVSGWAIHNLGNAKLIGACYRDIAGLLKAGASFLNYDLLDHVGGVALHDELLRDAGFVNVDCIWHETPAAIIAARTSAI